MSSVENMDQADIMVRTKTGLHKGTVIAESARVEYPMPDEPKNR